MNTEDLTRTFPFTVRPGHRETLDSYTRRTLAANSESKALPRELMKLAQQTAPAATWASVLSTKTGRPLDRLLTPPARAAHGDSDCRSCASLLTERWGCVLCHQGAHVQQHPHLEDFVCERHHRWTAPGTTPSTQVPVSEQAVDAHRKLRRLRRTDRADMDLLLDLIPALTEDLDKTHADVFHHAVAILQWVTRRPTMHRLFNPATPYSTTYAWMKECLDNIVARQAPKAARALWLHLGPGHIALNAALRGYTGYHAGHPHEFSLPDDVTTWYPRPETFQPWNDYLACSGDNNLSALAQRAREEAEVPSPTSPRFGPAWCAKGHRYTEVITGTDEGAPRTPCPRCTKSYVTPGVNDLATVAPAIAAELHPVLNGDLTAADIAATSSKPVWWRCALGHPHSATPSNRTLTGAGCAVCLNRVVLKGVNDIATTHPRIARELHPSSARRQSTTTFAATDDKLRLWLCPDGHEYKATARERTKNGKSCKECKKKRVRTSGRSLVDTHPHLAAQWLPELNEGREPHEFTKGSHLEVVWWCETGHPFTQRIDARTRGCTCPYCARRLLLTGFNDFATTHPELAGEWHPYKNWKDASEVMAGSDLKFFWRCAAEGHETHQSIPRRIESQGCKRCHPEERAGRVDGPRGVPMVV